MAARDISHNITHSGLKLKLKRYQLDITFSSFFFMVRVVQQSNQLPWGNSELLLSGSLHAVA